MPYVATLAVLLVGKFQNENRSVHLTERARARHGALMAIWLVYGSSNLEP